MPEGGTMALRGLGSRVDQALNSVSRGRSYQGRRLVSWPPNGDAAPASRDTSEVAGSDGYDGPTSYVGSERHDTIPSPPPELESAPWHDER